MNPMRVPRVLRTITALCLAAALGACSSVRPWINEPMREASTTAPTLLMSGRDPAILVAVTLSGGGARAAAFGYGVLSELKRTRFEWGGREHTLLDATDVISGVSGGSILAAYYAAFGVDGLANFERDFLRQNFQNSLITQTLQPSHLVELTSPWFGRSQLLARRLDLLYQGKTFADIERDPRHPQLVISATDMSLGTSFEFTAEQFELICSDLQSVPLSLAVAASSAVPLALSPVTLRNYAADCSERGISPQQREGRGGNYRARMYRTQEASYLDGKRRPYIHLVDGGLADNLGVRLLLDRTLAGGGLRKSISELGIPAGSVQKLVLITVNSSRDPATNIDLMDSVPGPIEVADALLFGAGERATVETQEFLADITRQWRNELKTRRADGQVDAFAENAEVHVVQANLRDAAEGELRRTLLQVPTAFSITNAEVTRLIEAGRNVLLRSPEFQALKRSLNASADH